MVTSRVLHKDSNEAALEISKDDEGLVDLHRDRNG